MQRINLTIDDIAFGGKGVGRSDGKAVFVPFTIDSETISAEIVREKKQFAEAEIVEIVKSSPHRVKPPCPYFGACGGCAYQHIDYEHQLAVKWRQVRDVIRRIGKIPDPPLRPIVSSPAQYAYRNRITVHAQDGVIGFFRRDSHRLIDIECCPIAMGEVNEALHELRKQRPRDGHYTLRAAATPRVFAQTNDAVAQAIRDLVVSLVPSNQELLIDAYCGAGFFAKALLDKFDRIIGIDWDRFAIEEARKSVSDKETYIAGDVEEELSRSGGFPTAEPYTWRSGERRSLTLIVDPPATGLTSTVRNAIIDLAPTTFVYVSCNPATLARDIKEFQDRFSIESVTPLDMFPQTAEIEVVSHLQLSSTT